MALFETLLAKIGIDSKDAQDDLKKTKDGTKDLGAQFKDLKGDLQNTMLGLFAMEKVMQAVGAAVDFVKDSTAAYVSTSTDAQSVLAGTSAKLEDLKVGLGEAIIGGQNLDVVMGSVNTVLEAFDAVVSANKDAIQGFVRDGLEAVITVGSKAGYVVAGVINLFKILAFTARMTWEGLNAFADTVSLLGAKLVELGSHALLGVLKGFDAVRTGALNVAETLADVAGNRELAQWAHDQASTIKTAGKEYERFLTGVADANHHIADRSLADLEEHQATMLARWNQIDDDLISTLDSAEAFATILSRGLEDGAAASAVIRRNTEETARTAQGAEQSEAAGPSPYDAMRADQERWLREQEALAAELARRQEEQQRQLADKAAAGLKARKETMLAEQAAAAESAMAPAKALDESFTAMGDQAAASAKQAASAMTSYMGGAIASIITGTQKADESFGEMAARMASSMAATFSQLFAQLGAGMLFINPAAGLGLIAASVALSTLSALLGRAGGSGGGGAPSVAPSGPAAPSAADSGARNVYIVQHNSDLFPSEESNLRRFAGMQRMARDAGLLGYQTSAAG